MFLYILGLTALGLLVPVPTAHAGLIAWRFEHGKNWMPIPLKMAFPALAWPMALAGMFIGLCSLLLLLVLPTFSVAWYISLLVSTLAVGSALAHMMQIRRSTAVHDGFERAFGPEWRAKLPKISGMLTRRWSPFRYPSRPVHLERDVVIWTYPENERQLLADLWLPAEGTRPTGAAFLFFHGSAWHFSDKGVGTDPMCRHLAAQGHVVLDVAYRLAPEVDITGMVSDVKRAVAWVKQNAGSYGVDPNRIVVGGASAGGHISLLAAYGNDHPAFSPADLTGCDTRVAGVISLYGPCDMRAYLQHHAGRLTTTGKRVTERGPVAFDALSAEQMMMNLLGGMPDEVPAMYDLADVSAHVTSEAPPALIVQGEVDFITATAATRKLVQELRQASVPVVYLELPKTDHAWDVGTAMANMAMGRRIVPEFLDSQYSPAMTATLYDMERFLAYIAA